VAALPGHRPDVSAAPDGEPSDNARVFGGSNDGDARSDAFIGPEEPAGSPKR
jgi:hypothetical protein